MKSRCTKLISVSPVETRAQMSSNQLGSYQTEDMELFNLFSEAFRNLPLAHLVDNKAATIPWGWLWVNGLPGADSHRLVGPFWNSRTGWMPSRFAPRNGIDVIHLNPHFDGGQNFLNHILFLNSQPLLRCDGVELHMARDAIDMRITYRHWITWYVPQNIL